MQALWKPILSYGQPYISYPFFWGAPALIGHVAICSYFSIKDIRKEKEGKIQKDYFPDVKHILSIAIPQILLFIFMGTIGVYLFPHTQFLHNKMPDKALSISNHFFEIVSLLVMGDFLIYWYHRGAHTFPTFRKKVHDFHHTYSTVFSWAGTYIHPVEGACAVLCQLIPHWIINPHPLSIWVHMTVWTILLDEEHSGYDIWWSPHHILPLNIGGGGMEHDIHHYKPSKNYGFILNIWDKFFGTYEPVSPNNQNPYVPPFIKERKKIKK